MSKTKTKTYLFHERSSIFPLIEGEEFEDLVKDIEEFGQQVVGVLFEGKILDGRNRYRACQKLGIPFKCEEYSGKMDSLDYILSVNLHRRHLNSAQRAAVGLLLLEEEEKKARERRKRIAEETSKLKRPKGSTKFVEPTKMQKNILVEKIDKIKKELGEGASVEIVAPKVKIGSRTLSKAKKIKEIAKKDKFIAKEWEEAKKGESSIDAVYQKAQIVEGIVDLTKQQQVNIKEKLDKEEQSIKQIKQEVQDIKDNLKRTEIAERNRAKQKKKAEKEKLYLDIRRLNKNLGELDSAFKLTEANLDILSKETVKKYPHLTSDDSAYVITQIGIYYDTLDMKIFDENLKKLRKEYDGLEKPLRDKLLVIEGEYQAKKDVIDKQKSAKNKEVNWVEKQQELMLEEFDKQDLYKGSIEKFKKELKEIQEKYDEDV